ncbi:MAG TPA: ABC transporter transmembrane domain-containing protein [Clostridiales bacterium]|nr:ABC transporter transmembrane domain-containing protein [Clostridiales bacterium]
MRRHGGFGMHQGPGGGTGPMQSPVPVGEKRKLTMKETLKIMSRLWKYLYRFKWYGLLAIVLSITSNLLSLVGPLLSGRAIDAIGTRPGAVDFGKVFYYCILMVIFYILSSVLSYILSILMIRISQKVIFQMRSDVLNKLLDLPVRFFDSHQPGEIISRISYDIDTVNASLSNDLLQIFTSLFTVVGSS